MKTVKKFVLIKMGLLFALALTSCLGSANITFGQSGSADTRPPPPPKPLASPAKLDIGKIEGLTYSNDQFGFSFSAPATWVVRDESASNAVLEEARRIAGDEKNPTLKANLEASVERTTLLFTATKFVPGSSGTSGALNAALSFVAERVPTAIISTPRHFYDIMLRSVSQTQGVKVEVLKPFQTKRIGTTDFGTYTIKVTTSNGVVVQTHLIAIRALYAYGLFFTYIDNEDAATFADVIATIKTK